MHAWHARHPWHPWHAWHSWHAWPTIAACILVCARPTSVTRNGSQAWPSSVGTTTRNRWSLATTACPVLLPGWSWPYSISSGPPGLCICHYVEPHSGANRWNRTREGYTCLRYYKHILITNVLLYKPEGIARLRYRAKVFIDATAHTYRTHLR